MNRLASCTTRNVRRLLSLVCLLTGLLCVATSHAETVQSLAGSWRFSLDADDEGVSGKWFAAALSGEQTIKLPGTTDEGGFGKPTVGAEPNVLTRVVKYVGPAWYQREVEVPQAWRNKPVELFLERVIWQSRVWVDGRPCDEQESLNTPHVHQLGVLTPGKHVLTLRIDNRELYPIGDFGHCYTEQTQTIWNGAVGRVELRARDAISLAHTRVFTRQEKNQVEAEVTLQNTGAAASPVTLRLAVRQAGSPQIVAQMEGQYTAHAGSTVVRPVLTLTQPAELWDEFSPQRYELEVALTADGASDAIRQPFGFREVSRSGQHLALNGRKVFLRGNLDCVIFPLTGYPAMDVEGWKRIFQIYRDNGLNHVRFHSWSPPEAAFTAADELGIYIQAEVIWTQRPLGNDHGKDGSIDEYVHAEMRRVVDTYGNHPSFVLFTIGNELGRFDHDVCGRWIQEIKTHDPRRLYSVSTARAVVPQDDFHVTHAIPGVGGCRDRAEARNDWDYENVYSRATVPTIAHEVGQWPVHPTWKEIGKYRGVLRARDFEHFHELAEASGVAQLDEEFRAASGALGLRLYKDQIESHLRTPSCAGFQLLSMQDFPGQGEALVGWLDAFYDGKGLVAPERVRRWCEVTVPLVRMPTYLYRTGDTLTAQVEVAHYGAQPLERARALWTLRDAKGAKLAGGELATVDLPVSSVTQIGAITAKLDSCQAPCRARLEVKLDGTPFANDWDVWIFPTELPDETGAVAICDSGPTAIEKLRAGGKVLLDAHQFGSRENANFARFKPAYWSAAFFRGQYTLGALVRDAHPALAKFPTEGHYDWQWEELCRNAHAFRLGDLPLDYQPIVQPIGDFHYGWKFGTVFELRVGKGSLLVCGYDITNNLDQRPAARQLRASLLAYMNSPQFSPTTEVDESLLLKVLPVAALAAPIAMPQGFENALLFVKAGEHHPSMGRANWQPKLDAARIGEPGFGYTVDCDTVWKDATGTAWCFSGDEQRIEMTVPKANLYDLYVHFQDWNNLGRLGTIQFEGRKYELGDHQGEGKWVKLEVLREDCRDDKLVLQATPTSGPNLQVTAIALVPK